MSLATKDLKSQNLIFFQVVFVPKLNQTVSAELSQHTLKKLNVKLQQVCGCYDELRLAKHDDLVFGRVSKPKCFQTSSVVKA